MQKSYQTTLHSALWTLKWLGNCVKYWVTCENKLIPENLILVFSSSNQCQTHSPDVTLVFASAAESSTAGGGWAFCVLPCQNSSSWWAAPPSPMQLWPRCPFGDSRWAAATASPSGYMGFGVFFVLPKWTSVIRNCMKTSKLISFKPLNSCQPQSTLSIQMCH